MSKLPELLRNRRLLLPVALAGLLLAAFLAADPAGWLQIPDEDESTISHAVRENPDARVAAPAIAASGISGSAAVAVVASAPADIFAVRTWEPPPPPPDLSPPPPPPPPPLPFRFIGRVAEPGKKIAFMLAEGQRIFVVSVGDLIGSTYRVESFENGQLFLRYRPMNVRQALDVRSNS
jgi:hypothetical protein